MCHNDFIAVGNGGRSRPPYRAFSNDHDHFSILTEEVQKFPINMSAKTMPCKLDTQSFQAHAPLSKVDPFGHEEFSLITAE